MKYSHTLATAAIGVMAFSPLVQAQTAVDLELFFLVDVSGSISGANFDLQRDGYADAFKDTDVITALTNGTLGKSAVTLGYWSTEGLQALIPGGWFLIEDAASATVFSDAVATFERPFDGLTGIGPALEWATPLFGTETGGDENGFTSTNQIIDVSGDGVNNSGISAAAGRAIALGAGVDVINGLVIGTDLDVLAEYTNNVIGSTVPGVDAFVVQVDDFDGFSDAIVDKIIEEGDLEETVPEPSSVLALISLGVVSLLGKLSKVRK